MSDSSIENRRSEIATYQASVTRGLVHWDMLPTQKDALLLLCRETYGAGREFTHVDTRDWSEFLNTTPGMLRSRLEDLADWHRAIVFDAHSGRAGLLPDYRAWLHFQVKARKKNERFGVLALDPGGELTRELERSALEVSRNAVLEAPPAPPLQVESCENTCKLGSLARGIIRGADAGMVKQNLFTGEKSCEPSKMRGSAARRDGEADFKERMAIILGPAEEPVRARFPNSFFDGGKWTSYFRQQPVTALAVLHELEGMVKEGRPFTGSAAQCAQYLWNEFRQRQQPSTQRQT